TMTVFMGGDVYMAEFNPMVYLQHFRVEEEVMIILNHSLTQSGAVKGCTLIDICSGPTIYQLLSACEFFKEITASEYTDQNCQEMLKWLKNEAGAFDWTPVVQHVCQLEGDRYRTWAEKEGKIQRAIKCILKCDVHKSNALDSVVLPPADCLVTSLCFEAACKDQSSYRAAPRDISSLQKPGGTWRKVEIWAPVSTWLVHKSSPVCAAGFTIEKVEVLSRADVAMHDINDFSGMYFIVALSRPRGSPSWHK
uniref:Indolethylamine N-methyltransferase n=1 Tax=Crocodylus porosus TaxID=8502 RepID=A0A7M4EME2_CROPO